MDRYRIEVKIRSCSSVDESSSVLRGCYAIGDTRVSRSFPSSRSSLYIGSGKRSQNPVLRIFSFVAVCKYVEREGSSSRTTDRGASYRILPPFVFAIRDYVTTMIHDDIYFGICIRVAVDLLPKFWILRERIFRRLPLHGCPSNDHLKSFAVIVNQPSRNHRQEDRVAKGRYLDYRSILFFFLFLFFSNDSTSNYYTLV